MTRKERTAAARSNWPPGAWDIPPERTGGGAPTLGLEAVGIGGFPGIFGAGFAATTGGLGLAARGGGALPANALEGREFPGESSGVDDEVDTCFFHGVADPFEAAIPGKTETGLAEALAVTECNEALVAGTGACFAAGAEGGARARGGGGGAGAALGGSNSR